MWQGSCGRGCCFWVVEAYVRLWSSFIVLSWEKEFDVSKIDVSNMLVEIFGTPH